MADIEKNILQVKKDIEESELTFCREKNSVMLIAVSKTHSIEKIKKAYSAGQRDFGENYLQESLEKIEKLKDLDINWHFIGSIQSNKAKLISHNFDWVHSIDKLKTLEKINQHRRDLNKKINICIQVNVDQEDSKSGLEISEIEDFLLESRKFDMMNLRGLMAIPRPQKTHELQYKTFLRVKKIYDELLNKGYNLDTLSIGMSSDYSAAIEAGSTCIRIGTAIFGQREK